MTNELVGYTPVELPSRGILYKENSVLRQGRVFVRKMTVRDEALLGTRREEDRAKVVDLLIKNCVNEKFDINELLVTDKLFILFAIRRITYGPEYKFKLRCTNCDFVFLHTVQIFDSFKVRVLEDNEIEPYSVLLPDCNKTIKFRMLRVEDEREIEKYNRSKLLQGASIVGDPTYSYRLARHIVDITPFEPASKDGSLTMSDKISFVETLTGLDSAVFRDAILSHQSGLELTMSVECPQCGNVFEELLPITVDFFRPNSARAGRI